MVQLNTIGRELAMGSEGGFGQSKEFLNLVKSIGEPRFKAEEERIVLSEIDILNRRLLEPRYAEEEDERLSQKVVYSTVLLWGLPRHPIEP